MTEWIIQLRDQIIIQVSDQVLKGDSLLDLKKEKNNPLN